MKNNEPKAKDPGVYDATGAKLIHENGVLRRADNADIEWPLDVVDEPWVGPVPRGITTRHA